MVREMGAVAGPSGRVGFERALSHHVQVRNARCDSWLWRREEILQNQLQKNHACREPQGARSKRAERAARVRARIVAPCPGPELSLCLAAAAARRKCSEPTPKESALPPTAGGGVKTARARFCAGLSGRTCGSGAAAAQRKAASIDAPLERASSVARLRFHPIAISRMNAAHR